MSAPGITSVLDLHLLHQLGDRLQRLRKERGLGTVELAKQVGISRSTLHAVESGDPGTGIGTYLRVMSALGIGGELVMLASDATQPAPPYSAVVRSRRARPSDQVVVSVDTMEHQVQDLQSLAMHAAAVRLIKNNDELRMRARATLESWLQKNPQSRSTPLWKEWGLILSKGTYRLALSRSAHAQQLRQASPLPTILPTEVRSSLLEDVRKLKSGVILGDPSKAIEA